MADKHNKSKLQKLSEFNFKDTVNHIALVTSAANGKIKPLIVKSLGEMGSEGVDEKPSGVKVTMSLEDALTVIMGCYNRENAVLLANSVVKSIDDPEKAVELNQALAELISKNGSPNGATGHSEAVTGDATSNITNINNEEGNSMTESVNKGANEGEQVLKMSDVEALIKKAKEEGQAESKAALETVTKQLETLAKEEDARQDAKYGAMAEGYKVLGATGDTAKVLKSLNSESPESFKVVKSLLDSAMAVVKNTDKLAAQGEDGSSNVGTDSMAELKQVAAQIEKSDKVTPARAMVLAAERNPHLVK